MIIRFRVVWQLKQRGAVRALLPCGGEWKLVGPHRKEVSLLPTDVFICNK